MIVADYIVDFLYRHGVRKIFMLSGTGSVRLDDAFARKDGMSYVCSRHEATAVVMAEAVSKLTNTIGVSVVTTGPGGANAIPGVIEAWVDSTPVIIISGQVESKQYIKDRAFGIQGFNIIDNVKRFTKYAVMLEEPSSIRYHLERAVYEATSGRPGPVWIDIPMDFQSAELDVENMHGFLPPPEKEKHHLGPKFRKLEKLINESERPLVAFGRGIKISQMNKELVRFLEESNIPSISARMANDVLKYGSDTYFGMGGIRGRRCATRIMKEADLLISIGSSNCYTFFGEKGDCLSEDCKIACVNIDPAAYDRSDIDISLAIESDLKDFFDFFKNVSFGKTFGPWKRNCLEVKEKYQMVSDDDRGDPINSYYLAETLSELTSKNHIFVNDAGSSNYISSQSLKFEKGQREITSGAFYTMGLTLPLSVGAAIADPDAQIIAISGDGSIELNIQELQTISLNKLDIKIFVINNGGYASIRDSQDAMCGGRYTDDEQILNFQKVSEAFQLDYFIIKSASEMKEKISEILKTSGPSLIEVVCDPNQYMVQPIKEIKGDLS